MEGEKIPMVKCPVCKKIRICGDWIKVSSLDSLVQVRYEILTKMDKFEFIKTKCHECEKK